MNKSFTKRSVVFGVMLLIVHFIVFFLSALLINRNVKAKIINNANIVSYNINTIDEGAYDEMIHTFYINDSIVIIYDNNGNYKYTCDHDLVNVFNNKGLNKIQYLFNNGIIYGYILVSSGEDIILSAIILNHYFNCFFIAALSCLIFFIVIYLVTINAFFKGRYLKDEEIYEYINILDNVEDFEVEKYKSLIVDKPSKDFLLALEKNKEKLLKCQLEKRYMNLLFENSDEVMMILDEALNPLLCMERTNNDVLHQLDSKTELMSIINSNYYQDFVYSNKTYDFVDFKYDNRDIRAHFKKVIDVEDCFYLLILTDESDFKNEIMKNEMLFNNASHELKTPLTILKGYLELLKYGRLDTEESKSVIDKSIDNCDSLKQLIDNILAASKSNKNIKKFELANVSRNLYEILSNFECVIKNKGIELEVDIDDIEFPCHINNIKRIFTNLISNAIKYNKINGSILISLKKSEEGFTFICSDTGIGMNKYELEHMYDKFYHSDSLQTSTGLGLQVVKNICETYSYQIRCESKRGKGTTFTIIFK